MYFDFTNAQKSKRLTGIALLCFGTRSIEVHWFIAAGKIHEGSRLHCLPKNAIPTSGLNNSRDWSETHALKPLFSAYYLERY